MVWVQICVTRYKVVLAQARPPRSEEGATLVKPQSFLSHLSFHFPFCFPFYFPFDFPSGCNTPKLHKP